MSWRVGWRQPGSEGERAGKDAGRTSGAARPAFRASSSSFCRRRSSALRIFPLAEAMLDYFWESVSGVAHARGADRGGHPR